ncbi:hypothetical protein A2914_02865 [Candidatus Nomurabacteria bacterium RIFCSPLOWO2_01_FULL_41_21]|uniref:Toxin YoeB n=2 Tax=Candidatus Nomuraibacteriota TaxID=1752729 RepID=A0A1F6V4D7_9BACT|nr:MAG: hypothetical protein A2733_01000 [Candidatus Nomurabacteria bacterium RIFCSPHIGHO2_01_FULL_40_20]OGI88874.1 MAG: hypothetical protein A2914_02865 [Candidatus Nomurabacteria bacterium RIFCSPLOWO2_01_FULL_41_21]
MIIRYTAKFKREYSKLILEIQKKAETREKVFRLSPFAPTLKTHKLSGDLEDLWAFSVDYNYRIIFEFLENEIVIFHSIGDHDIYK